MIIRYKGLNPNETFCCTQKDVKHIFRDADIKTIFGLYNMSRNEKENSEEYRPYKKCKDIIVAKMVACKKDTDVYGLSIGSYISFFILKKESFSEELHKKFVNEILPKLKELYDEHKNDNFKLNHGAYAVTVGLKDI